MENPSKFTVLSSSKGNNVPDSHDRLGGLPEHVVHHIISFLEANDIARLSFASKGCRQICISSPYLYFDVDFASQECATKCSQFKEFLSKFLRSRNGQLIQLLRFRWLCDSCECSNERPYDSWICDALGCNVKELDIGYRIDEQNRLALPISETGYSSLRLLELNLQDCCINSILPATLVSLEVLSLKSLRVYGAILEDWISTSCASLKRLNLEAVEIMDGFPISTTSSLQELTIHNCYVNHIMGFCKNSIKGSSLKNVTISDCKFRETGLSKIKIACSSLVNLTLRGCVFGLGCYVSIGCPLLENLTIHRCFVNESYGIDIRHCPSLTNLMMSHCTFQLLYLNIPTSSLRKLSVFECSSQFPVRIAVSAEQLQTLSVKLYGSWWNGSVFEIQPQNLICLQEAIVELVDLQFFIADKDMSISVLRAVQYARVLQLSIQIIEVLSSEDHAEILFENLCDLVIVCDKLEVCQMIVLACFVMRAPYLRTLTIKYEHKSGGFSETEVQEDLAKLLSSAVKMHQLKYGNSETLLLGDQFMKLKLSLQKN
uniref:F-box domain-containing protein n=1 Tax=Salix viminalis TaxID=40686 RepID=A0A6N2KW82_SALVM